MNGQTLALGLVAAAVLYAVAQHSKPKPPPPLLAPSYTGAVGLGEGNAIGVGIPGYPGPNGWVRLPQASKGTLGF